MSTFETNEWARRKLPETKLKNKVWYEAYDEIYPIRRQFYTDAVFKYDPKSILEVGCAGGANINYFLKNKKAEIIGIDINKEAIEYAKHTKPNADYYHHDIIQPFDFLKSKVDIVCSMGVLIHISPKVIDVVLANMLNACTKGMVLMETSDTEKTFKAVQYPQFIHDIPNRIRKIDSSVNISVSRLKGEINDAGASASSICLIEIMK